MITVKKAETGKPFIWHTDKDGSHALVWSSDLRLLISEDGGEPRWFNFRFRGRDDVPGTPGFRCDGLSVPRAFRWFLPSWDTSNELYNLAGAFHDWLYATKGFCGRWSRSECDDAFRGILRESGMSRFKASTADFAVGLFAGNSRHWGNDSYGVANLVTLESLEGQCLL